MSLRVLVTGGAGFVGRHVVAALLARGHAICVVDDLSKGSAAGLPAGAALIAQDIRHPSFAATCRAFAPEAVVHLAAQSEVSRSLREPVFDAAVNVLGTLEVIEAAKAAGARRLVFASSGGTVYGQAKQLPTPECAPLAAVSPYGASKAAAEQYVQLAGAQGALCALSLRLANVFGPGQSADGEAGVVARFARALTGGRAIGLCGDGQQARDFLWVGDAARAIVSACERPWVQGTVNVGTGRATTIAALAEAMARLAEVPLRIDWLPARPAEVRTSCLCPARAEATLGFRAKWTLERGLAATLSFWRQEGPQPAAGTAAPPGPTRGRPEALRPLVEPSARC